MGKDQCEGVNCIVFTLLPAVVARQLRNMAKCMGSNWTYHAVKTHAKVCLRHLWVVAPKEVHRLLLGSAFALPMFRQFHSPLTAIYITVAWNLKRRHVDQLVL